MKNKNLIISLIVVVLVVIVIFIPLNFNKVPKFLDDEEIENMFYDAIQDEYKAEATYEKVITEHGEINPFTNIINAEVKHSEAIKRLYEFYDLTVPNNNWEDSSNIPSFNSVQEACQAAVQAEIENIEIYDEFLENELPDNVRQVFTSNRRASEEKHLPAFERCS